MSKSCSVLIFVVISVLYTLGVCAEPRVLYRNGELSLDVHEIELRDILEVLERQGIKVYIGEGVNPVISATFKNRPVGDAFSAILKGHDYSLIWRKGRAKGPIRLEEIQVFERGKTPALHRVGIGGLDIVSGKNDTLMIRDTVLIMLEKGVSRERLEALIATYNGTLAKLDEQRGIALVRLPNGSDPEAISDKLAQSDLIEVAEPDYAYELPGVTRLGEIPLSGSGAADSETNESEIRIAVLDSGLAPVYLENQFLAGAYDALASSRQISDDSGHGTQMALIAAGIVDPLGTIAESRQTTAVLAVRTFDQNGYTSTSTLKNGIDYALASGARVVSMSWGSETDSKMLESIVDYASDNGLILVAAVGNEPSGVPVYPAAYENVIGIGALTPDGNPWPQSNYGSFVDGEFSGLALFSEGDDETSDMYAGTSISTAYASRKIAEFLDKNPDADKDLILEKLFKQLGAKK